MQIEINGQSLILGLEWFLESSSKEADKVLAGHKKSPFIKRKVMGDKYIVGISSHDDKSKSGACSGAYLIAQLQRDCVISHQIDPNTFWVCAIQDGAPLPGFDLILSGEDYRQKISEAMMYMPSAMIIGNSPGCQQSVESLVGSSTKKQIKESRLFSRERSVKKLAYVSSMAASIALIAWFGVANYQRILGNKAMEEAQKQAHETDVFLREQEAKRLNDFRKNFDRQIEAARLDMEMHIPPKEQLAVWVDVVKAIPFYEDGYRLAAVGCRPEACSAVWISRSIWANPNKFDDRPGFTPGVSLPNGDTVEVPPDQFAYTQTIPVKPIEKQHLPRGVLHEKAIREAKIEFLRNERSLKAIGISSFDFDPKTEDVIIQPPKELEGVRPEKIGSGTYLRFASSKAGPTALIELLDVIQIPMAIEGISFKSFDSGSPSVAAVALFKTPIEK